MDDHQEKKDGLFEIHRENIYFRWGLTAVIVIVVCIIAAQFITKMPAFFGYVKAFLGTLSPVLYGLGSKKNPIFHTVFHVFVDIGSILHAVCVLCYVL